MITGLWQRIAQALKPQASELERKGQYPRQAAVMVLLTDEPEPEMIFTLRAKHLNHHAGEVCFPGGMWEPQDDSLLTTALRETHEEIGLHPSLVDVIGALPAHETRSGTRVRPFVGRVPASTKFYLNHHELQLLFKVPVEAFSQGLQVRTDIFDRGGNRLRIPAYVYQGYEIWGFTAAVTAELLPALQPAATKPV